MTFKQKLLQWTAITAVRSIRFWIMAGIAMAAWVAALAVSRGRMGLSSLSFSYAHQVLLFASSQGIDQYLHWPPGYALLAIPLHGLGLIPLRALWIISLLAFALAAICMYRIAFRCTDQRKALVAVSLFLFNPMMLQWANQAMTEMAFIAAVLLAYDLLGTVFFQEQQKNVTAFLLAGVAFALPYWMRYIGLLATVACIVTVVLLYVLGKIKCKAAVIPLAVALPAVALLLLRNLAYKNSLTGHLVGQEPRANFLSALTDTLHLLLQGWLPLPSALSGLFDHPVILLLFFCFLLIIAVINWKNYYMLLVSAFPIYYCVAFCYAYSHTRIDLLNERFVTPVIPFITLGVIFLWQEVEQRHNVKSVTKRAICLLIFSLLVYILLKGILLGRKGLPDSDRRLSAQTIDYILQKLPKGSRCAGNRNQIQAYSLDYPFFQIPGNRPEDEDYHAFRRKTWTRASAIAFWLAQDIQYILFFTGKNNSDPVLQTRGYGGYVDSLRTILLPEIAERVVLSDGLVIKLQDSRKLTELSK